MERTITINIENLIDKLEISNSGCVNLANLETSIQDALLKAVNFASFEHIEKSDTAKEVNSSKSRLSEERAYREHYLSPKEKPVINLHIQTLIGKVEIVNLPFDPNTDISGLSSKQVTRIQEIVVSALLETLKNLNKSQEILDKDSPDDTDKKESH